jgi:hypothetical protein
MPQARARFTGSSISESDAASISAGTTARRLALDIPHILRAMLPGQGGQRMNKQPGSDAVLPVGDAGDPHIRASAAYLFGQLRVPGERVLSLGAAGEVVLRARLVERAFCAARLPAGRSEAIALACGEEPGVLLVEPTTALGLVSAVLGLSRPPLAGPLTSLERAVLEGTIATGLARLGLAGAIAVRGGAADRLPPGSLAVELSLGWCGEAGCAWLVASDDALADLGNLSDAGRDESAPWLEVASTEVPPGELAGAEVGDTLVFDETAARSGATAWPARLLWRRRAVPVLWRSDGSVVGVAPRADASATLATTRLDRGPAGNDRAAQPRVGAEVSAGADCPVAEPGERAPLVISRSDPILLKVRGRLWGRGKITEHAGAFAVVITQKATG